MSDLQMGRIEKISDQPARPPMSDSGVVIDFSTLMRENETLRAEVENRKNGMALMLANSEDMAEEIERLNAELARLNADGLARRVVALEVERDEALRQNAESSALMDAYRDLVVTWHKYDKAQPAQGLFEQLEAITKRVQLNNAGVAFLKKHEALKAERDALREALVEITEWRSDYPPYEQLAGVMEIAREALEALANPRHDATGEGV